MLKMHYMAWEIATCIYESQETTNSDRRGIETVQWKASKVLCGICQQDKMRPALTKSEDTHAHNYLHLAGNFAYQALSLFSMGAEVNGLISTPKGPSLETLYTCTQCYPYIHVHNYWVLHPVWNLVGVTVGMSKCKIWLVYSHYNQRAWLYGGL